MIIIINGSLGIGKSVTSWALHAALGQGVMLDGDFICAVEPFEIYDKGRTEYLYDTFELLLRFHLERGKYSNFVINYVFECEEELNSLLNRLEKLDSDIHVFRIVCEEQERIRRIHKRGEDSDGWQKKRTVELHEIQEKASQKGFIGKVLDTTGKTPEETAWEIIKKIREKNTFDTADMSILR